MKSLFLFPFCVFVQAPNAFLPACVAVSAWPSSCPALWLWLGRPHWSVSRTDGRGQLSGFSCCPLERTEKQAQTRPWFILSQGATAPGNSRKPEDLDATAPERPRLNAPTLAHNRDIPAHAGL